MSTISIKSGNTVKQEEFTLDRPSTVEEFIEKGYTPESINEMLVADDKRRLQSHHRAMFDKETSEFEGTHETRTKELNEFIFVPGRKPSEKSSKKAAKVKMDAFSIFQALSNKERAKLQNLPREEAEAVIQRGNVETIKERLAAIAD